MRPKRIKLSKIILYVIISIFSVVSIFPIIWVLLASFKENAEILVYPPTLIPVKWTIRNYLGIFSAINVTQSLFNSFIATLIGTVSVVISSCLAAYSITIIKVKGAGIITGIIMLGIVLPPQTTYIPLFTAESAFGLLDTRIGLLLPYLATAFGAFLMSQAYKKMPISIIDAATVDGLSHFGILGRIVFPLSKPSIMTLVIFTSMNIWRDFYWPFLVITKKVLRTLPLTVAYFWKSDGQLEWGHNLAICTVAITPLIIIYIACQKYFIEGVSWSGLKE